MKKNAGLTSGLAIIALSGATLLNATHAYAASQSSVGTMGRDFIGNAAQSNIEELTVSRKIAQNPPAAQDKAFAQRMITDHSKNQMMLEKVATQLKVPLPTTISPKQKAQNQKLMQLTGAAFQAAFRQDMIKDHMAAITDFRAEIAKGRNAQLKAYAVKSLPVLEMHLAMAKALPLTVSQTSQQSSSMKKM
jgi:putative membrane protein